MSFYPDPFFYASQYPQFRRASPPHTNAHPFAAHGPQGPQCPPGARRGQFFPDVESIFGAYGDYPNVHHAPPPHPAPPAPPAPHPAHPAHEAAEEHPGFSQFKGFPGVFEFAPPSGPSAPVGPAAARRPGLENLQHSNLEAEKIAADEEELEALRAFRANKKRQAERERAIREETARRNAAARLRAQEAARDLKIRAEVEANARAAARAYLKQKQERQNRIHLAQQAERERQQQNVLEQLCRQFGLFTIPTRDSSQRNDSAINSEFKPEHSNENADDDNNEQDKEVDEENTSNQNESNGSQNPEDADHRAEQFIDPIRSLIEALAPYPIVFTTESSDEEDAPRTNTASSKAPDSGVSTEFPETVSALYDLDGPTCETVTEDGIDDDDQGSAYVNVSEIPIASGDARKRHHKRRHNHHKKARDASHASEEQPSSQNQNRKHGHMEMNGILHALQLDFDRVNDSYNRLKNEPPTDSLQEIITRIEGIKLCYARSEDIYGKLDEMRVNKNQRSAKQALTSQSVSLADKCEELLKQFEDQKRIIRDQQPDAASDSPESPDSVHHATLEDVEDGSD